ncbi:MAG: ABC transporter permease, partial [Limisphaerales bacterium]
MTFLPIVSRELRVASRRRSTYWLRTGATVATILLGTWVFLFMQREPPQVLATYLFGTLTGSAILYGLLSGVRATADCLSEEKREGTLGLLFLTDLKGYDVVLGKLVANSVNAFYSVVAVLPVFAIPLLMGGLTPGEFGRMALIALNSLFFSLALGIGVSAVSRSAQKSMVATLGFLTLLTIVLPACVGFFSSSMKAVPLRLALLLPSAGYTYYLAWDTPYRLQSELFWYSLALLHVLGWGFLGLASLVTPRTWQDRPFGTKTVRWRERLRVWSFGGAQERTSFRERLLSQNAFFWLASRSRLKPALVWGFLGLVAAGWAWGLARNHHEWLNEGTYILTALLVNSVLKIWFAFETTSRLAEGRKAGTLELLLSTPLEVRDILRGQLLALARQFLGPLVLVLVVETLFMLATLSEPTMTDRASSISLWLSGMFMLVADLAALYWVGMWQGLTARNVGRATTGSLLRILVLPWIAFAIMMLLLLLIS